MEYSLIFENENDPHPFEFGELIIGTNNKVFCGDRFYMIHPALSEMINRAIGTMKRKRESFFERLWRSLKYECVYLHAFERGSEAKAGIGKWLAYYNDDRPHSTHGILTPNEAYASKTEPTRLAA